MSAKRRLPIPNTSNHLVIQSTSRRSQEKEKKEKEKEEVEELVKKYKEIENKLYKRPGYNIFIRSDPAEDTNTSNYFTSSESAQDAMLEYKNPDSKINRDKREISNKVSERTLDHLLKKTLNSLTRSNKGKGKGKGGKRNRKTKKRKNNKKK